MASREAGITWTTDTITSALASANSKAARYLSKTTEYYSLQTETYSKSKAPWTDRTGNARSSMSSGYLAEIGSSGRSTFQIEIAHGMPYGLWLEVRWGGKYGIINKTVQYQGPRFFAAANDVLSKIFGG